LTARILIVDDVPSNILLLEARLAAEYYEVKSIYDGLKVLAVADEWQPDAILLDVMMPNIDGYEICRQLKASPTTNTIPVIMVSALKESSDRLQGLACGADEFLSKPVEQEVLLARLRGIIRLKRLLDDWRNSVTTAHALGLTPDGSGEVSHLSSRVLIIDDLMVRAARLRDVLAQDGVDATIVSSESRALDEAESASYDLILISLSLVINDPLRMVARLRAAGSTRDTPLILIAEPYQRTLMINGLDLGANDCLVLPLDESEFLLRTRSHLKRKLYQDRLRSNLGNALQLAVTDSLTGLYNRRYLMNYLDGHYGVVGNPKLSALMIDVDHFKRINDRYGHGVGDAVLRDVAQVLSQNLRESDHIARYGGEEFVVVCFAENDVTSGHIAERLRSAIERHEFELDLKVTVSIGVARSLDADSAANLIELADAALYASKHAGRNRVSFGRPRPPLAAPDDRPVPIFPDGEKTL
jgi:two-component system cell cycle response regulator